MSYSSPEKIGLHCSSSTIVGPYNTPTVILVDYITQSPPWVMSNNIIDFVDAVGFKIEFDCIFCTYC